LLSKRKSLNVSGAGFTAASNSGFSSVHLHHLFPHVTGAGLAEVDFNLYSGFESLYIVEYERECDKTASDGDGAEHDGTESRLAHGLSFLHFVPKLQEPTV
jgi:hypothetical protein